MKIGIVGLPASGKTTLFNALTGGAARRAGGRPSEGGSLGTRGGGASQLRVGVAQAADPRLDALAEVFRPKKKTYAAVDFADVPGLGRADEAGARAKPSRSGAEAIPPALQGTDGLLLVLRAFEDPGVPHPRQSVDPARDLEDLRLDLLLRDLEVVERRVERLEKTVPAKKNPAEAAELELLRRLGGQLEEGRPLAAQGLSEEEALRLRGFGFLSAKPLLAAVNAGEDRLGEPPEAFGLAPAEGEGPPAIALCAKLEEELAQLPEEERAAFLAGYGLERPARDRVIEAAFAALGLVCFFTVMGEEVRAWPVRRGTTTLRAAGVVHSDLERGFIRAEVVSFEAFMEAGSMAAARERGALRLEGKDYPLQDGDILTVRFHV